MDDELPGRLAQEQVPEKFGRRQEPDRPGGLGCRGHTGSVTVYSVRSATAGDAQVPGVQQEDGAHHREVGDRQAADARVGVVEAGRAPAGPGGRLGVGRPRAP